MKKKSKEKKLIISIDESDLLRIQMALLEDSDRWTFKTYLKEPSLKLYKKFGLTENEDGKNICFNSLDNLIKNGETI